MNRSSSSLTCLLLMFLGASLLFACGGGAEPPPPSDCRAGKAPPVAEAGADQRVTPGTLVVLDGSASSARGYRWTLSTVPADSQAALSDATLDKPTFTVDVPGIYVATLIVADGCQESPPDSVVVTAEPPTPPANLRPVARAGSSQEVEVGLAVELDGSASADPEDHSLTYSWVVVSSPPGSTATLSRQTSAKPSFTPDLAGAYVLRLVVSDGALESEPAFLTLSVRSATAPVASPGASRTVLSRRPVTLDGSASTTAGGALTFAWSFVSVPPGSAASLSDEAAEKATFTPDLEGDYVVELVVSDGRRSSLPVALTLTAQNRAPVADAGADRAAVLGAAVSVPGRGIDENGDILTFAWTLIRKPTGSTATLREAHTRTPSLTLDVEGDYELSLVVEDGQATSPADAVVLRAQPPFVHRLSHRAVDAEYSKALDRIVMVSSNPNALYIHDPLTQTETSVALPAGPTSVSVGPDGQFAAVGHVQSISYVDLARARLVKTVPVTADVLDVVLAGNGFAYAFPRQDQWESIYSVNLATGVETLSNGFIYAGTRARLHPNGKAIYGADSGLSPSDIERYDISGGTAQYLYDSPYHGSYGMCGNLWFSEDGARIFTACGNTFRASDFRDEDMTYSGTLQGSGYIRHLTHSTAANRIAMVQGPYYYDDGQRVGTEVRFYLPEFLGFEQSIRLPSFQVNGAAFDSFGRFVFYSAAGDRLFVVVQADPVSGLLNDYGVVTF